MILVATGMKREAASLERDRVRVVTGGGRVVAFERVLEQLATAAAAVVSIGLAGALVGSLSPGDWIVDCADEAWRAALIAALPGARAGTIVGSDTPVATGAAKAALHTMSGADAVDMESHIAGRVASRHALPFAAIRVISDRAGDDLPRAALAAMRPDGGVSVGAVIAALLVRPRDVAALVRTARHAGKAFRALRRYGRRWPFPPVP